MLSSSSSGPLAYVDSANAFVESPWPRICSEWVMKSLGMLKLPR
jgi:hypothetical protein